MEVLGLLLFLAFVVAAIVSTIVYRDDRHRYAYAHRADAPFFTEMFRRDTAPDVEAARVRSNVTGLVALALVVLSVIALLVARQSES